MMEPRRPSDYKIEPEFLGPLGDRPLVELAGRSGPADLFPGASMFLNDRQQAARRKRWDAVRGLVGKLLAPDEHILHVAFAMQNPPALDGVGLGYLVYSYHQVLLVFTDRRIIETLLNFRANGPGTRIRSYAYRHVRSLKISFGRLLMTPAQGKKQAWRLNVRGDKKLLGLLLPRLQSRCLTEGAGQARALPQWHCPQCGGDVTVKPSSCASCGTVFRSSRLATLLSLAFPGAGLFYVGHPWLAACDFLGEATMFVIWLALMAGSSPEDGIAPALLLGGFLFLLTKLESVHVGRVLVARSIPEQPERRERFGKFAFGGALLSALLVATAFPVAGAARPRLDHDLDASTEDGAWTGSRKTAEWAFFKDDTDARSQWTHADTGAHLTLFAYPLGALDDETMFHRDYAAGMHANGFVSLVDDEEVPAPFRGFRYVGETKTKTGEPVAMVAYFLLDGETHDVHQVAITVPREDAEAAEALVRDFLTHARFIDATPPER